MDDKVYGQIGARTGGDIYIGVVGPVRSGKSSFIKRFMELLVLPNIQDPAMRARARDELPQSAAGRTIMTTEPKFVPEKAVSISLEGGAELRTRLIDCVGYMVEGTVGHEEDRKPRMVKSPWFNEEVPFDLAAETGTHKVITEHSTIGILVTTDGSISDIPRENYAGAEARIVAELDEMNKPYVILLNTIDPDSAAAKELAEQMEKQYGRSVIPVNCLDLQLEQLESILQHVLYEFPVRQMDFVLPKWVPMLEADHWLQKQIYDSIREWVSGGNRMKDLAERQPPQCEYVQSYAVESMDLSEGVVRVRITLDPGVFYQVLSEQTGLDVVDEAGLMPCVIQLVKAKREYEKVRNALEQVEATGYGIVMPTIDELQLEEPEIIRQGNRYGVRLKACAPSIHLMKAMIHTEVNPIVGSERQSEDLVKSLLADFSEDPLKIWESNIFGKSLHELVNEGLQNKLLHMPQDARGRLQNTLEKVINDGCSGLICIIF